MFDVVVRQQFSLLKVLTAVLHCKPHEVRQGEVKQSVPMARSVLCFLTSFARQRDIALLRGRRCGVAVHQSRIIHVIDA